jgi:quercetin dioxygenase-like cupin family protein
MATNIFDRCTNPITGETFKAVSLTPYAFTMQWTVQSGRHVPLEHLHEHQDEIFYVKKGEIKVLVEGKAHIAGEGQKVIIAKGKRHAAFNNGKDELDTWVEYRPPLDQHRIYQCYNGLINDGYLDKKGSVSVAMMCYMLKKMKCKAMLRPTGMSGPLFKLALNLYYWAGAMKGWDKLYAKYTG